MSVHRPAEAWIVNGDQSLALLVAMIQENSGKSDTIWWPQLASIVFPDRHLGSAQLRWTAAEKAAQILAKVILQCPSCAAACSFQNCSVNKLAKPFICSSSGEPFPELQGSEKWAAVHLAAGRPIIGTS